MKNIKIQQMTQEDMGKVIDIWYEASIKAHDFIPQSYWKSNMDTMKNKYLPMAETFVAIDKNEIVGFVSLVDICLAAIFVNPAKQGFGVGTELLNYVINKKDYLELKVFLKNKKSIQFYKKMGFIALLESIDKETGEKEMTMQYKGKKL